MVVVEALSRTVAKKYSEAVRCKFFQVNVSTSQVPKLAAAKAIRRAAAPRPSQ